MLGCPIVQAQILRKGPRSSFKVKIAKDYLLTALLSTEGKDHRARLWKNRSMLATYPVIPITTSQESAAKEPVSLTISSWNCRGLKFSAPYLQVLSNTSDIILLQEHWLWPFELHSLSSVLCGFSSHGSCDKRLNESSDLQRGCGGVGILWKESIAAHPIHLNTDCDRICAIALPLENHRVNKLIILNVYFPSTDSDPTTFMQCTLELEAILNRYSEEGGAVVIADDFNAHLGTLAGPLSITLQVSYSPIENLSSAARINWERAITTDSIHAYARAVSDYITPLLDSSSDDISQLDYEICGVCEATCRIASITLPHNSKKKACDFYNDKELIVKRANSAGLIGKMQAGHCQVTYMRRGTLTKRGSMHD